MDIDQWPDEIDIEDIIPAIVLGVAQKAKAKRTPRSTSLPGSIYLSELLESSPHRIYDVLRMQKHTFYKLCDWLEVNTSLEPSKHMLVQEQIAMFLWTINYSASNRQVMERFQHSGETVSRYILI
jgi:hypothetical protein